jgi:glyoxylate carboligase
LTKTVADQFAEILVAAGVKRIYGVVGDSLNGLTDALRRQGKIEWIHVRTRASLVVGERPDPVVQEGWVRVKMTHVSLNRHDVFTLRGLSAQGFSRFASFA